VEDRVYAIGGARDIVIAREVAGETFDADAFDHFHVRVVWQMQRANVLAVRDQCFSQVTTHASSGTCNQNLHSRLPRYSE
jgi:hypothetical protein